MALFDLPHQTQARRVHHKSMQLIPVHRLVAEKAQQRVFDGEWLAK